MQFVAQFGRKQNVPDEVELGRRRAELKRERGDAPATVVYRTEPTYPIDLRRVGGAGEATVNVSVDASGRPTAVRCVAASHPLMARAAEAAVLEWRFAPALRAGVPVASELVVPLMFSDPEAIVGR
ncbi:hypothetical protein DB354_06680 [Opitutus sp. ER46]|nr:hypothetical protein DB354_06680 [Opitutus sp. ER46]